MCDADSGSDSDRPHSLIVLLEEEIVAIDLMSSGWPPYKLPYLNRYVSAINLIVPRPARRVQWGRGEEEG